VEIVGTDGTAVLEENNLLTWQFRQEEKEDNAIRREYSGAESKGGVADPMDIGYFGHQQQIIDFIEAVRNDTTPLVDGEEGRKSVEIVCAIYESAKSGEEIILA
jgi:predicted dehydrogenase